MITIDRADRNQRAAARQAALAELARLPAVHRQVLAAALRAPSAHNAQPWRIRIIPGPAYELHYDHHEYLPADPQDRDAYLCMGAFCETLALAARAAGLTADIPLVLTRAGSDLHVADVVLRPAAPGPADPLAAHVGARATNRTRYTAEPLPAALAAELAELAARSSRPGGWRGSSAARPRCPGRTVSSSRTCMPGSAPIRPARTG